MFSSRELHGNGVGRGEFSGNQYTYSGEGVPVLLLVVAIRQVRTFSLPFLVVLFSMVGCFSGS